MGESGSRRARMPTHRKRRDEWGTRPKVMWGLRCGFGLINLKVDLDIEFNQNRLAVHHGGREGIFLHCG